MLNPDARAAQAKFAFLSNVVISGIGMILLTYIASQLK